MKKINLYKGIILCVFFASILLNNRLIAQKDSVVAVPIVKLHYFNENNSMQYLILESMLKKGKVLNPQKNKSYEIYLDSIGANLIAQVKTDETGKAKAFIPPSVKTAWDALPQHTFIVKEGDEEVLSDYVITKAKIELDTSSADDVKNIIVKVTKLEKDKWLPAKDVEMKVGIQRLGGILSAGDEQTYTTDSSGTVTVELKKNNLPGDKNGSITLVAKVENNDLFGNLMIEKNTAWGVPATEATDFFSQRTLWSTRFRTPIWLLLMAYSIVIAVWGTLIYLIMQLIKIKKLGTVSNQIFKISSSKAKGRSDKAESNV